MKLEEKRKEIDAIDRSIVDMLNQRAVIAREIAIMKTLSGLPITDLAREEEIIARVMSSTRDLRYTRSVERIYRSILRESKLIQASMRDELTLNGGR